MHFIPIAGLRIRESLGLFLGWIKLLGLCWNKFPIPSQARVQNTDTAHTIQNVFFIISILITTLHCQNCVMSGTNLLVSIVLCTEGCIFAQNRWNAMKYTYALFFCAGDF